MTDRAMLKLGFSFEDIFLKLIPRVVGETLRDGGLGRWLTDGDYQVAVEWFGRTFGYMLTKGGNLTAAEGEISHPALRITMSDGGSVSVAVDEAVLFGRIMPGLILDIISLTGRDAELAGTEFTLVMEISDSRYSFRVKDGKELTAGNDDIPDPMMRVILDRGELERMISIDNTDLLFAARGFLSRRKYDALRALRGTVVTKLRADDGEVKITLVLNGGTEPLVRFYFSPENFRSVMAGEKDPVSMFMTGAMKIKGDMGFAMSVRPLFVQS